MSRTSVPVHEFLGHNESSIHPLVGGLANLAAAFVNSNLRTQERQAEDARYIDERDYGRTQAADERDHRQKREDVADSDNDRNYREHVREFDLGRQDANQNRADDRATREKVAKTGGAGATAKRASPEDYNSVQKELILQFGDPEARDLPGKQAEARRKAIMDAFPQAMAKRGFNPDGSRVEPAAPASPAAGGFLGVIQQIIGALKGGGATTPAGRPATAAQPAQPADPFAAAAARQPTGSTPAYPGAPTVTKRAADFLAGGGQPATGVGATAGATAGAASDKTKPVPISSQFAAGVAARKAAYTKADDALAAGLYQAGALDPKMLAEDKKRIVDAIEAGDAATLTAILQARPHYRKAIADYANGRALALKTSPLANAIEGQ